MIDLSWKVARRGRRRGLRLARAGLGLGVLWALQAAALAAPASGAGSGALNGPLNGALGGGADQAAAAVQAVARAQLEAQALRDGLVEPLVELTVLGVTDNLPACPQKVAVEGIDTRYPARMRFAAVCPTRGDLAGWRREVVVRASTSAQVVVLGGEVPTGRPLVAADLVLERRSLQGIPDPVSDPQAVVGMVGQRALHSGEVLHRQLLTAAQLVRRGSPVRIVARSGPIEVTVAGEALDAGGRDEFVRVRNNATGKTIRARVTGDSTVEPADMPVTPQSAD